MKFPSSTIVLTALLWCPLGKAAVNAADIGASIDISSKRLNPPAYPPDAARECVSGTAVIIVDVDKDGRHVGAIVEKSSRDPRLDQAALDASRQWRYTAGTIDGEAVAGRIRLPVDFKLDDACWSAGGADVQASPSQNSLDQFPVSWPVEVGQLGLSGSLVLRARIDPDGRPASVDIQTSSGDPRIDAAALRAARNWEYIPASRRGDPVRSILLLPMPYGQQR